MKDTQSSIPKSDIAHSLPSHELAKQKLLHAITDKNSPPRLASRLEACLEKISWHEFPNLEVTKDCK